MQRIKTVRWPTRNIGGDRASVKLRYVQGQSWSITGGASSTSQNLAFNVGASIAPNPLAQNTIYARFGNSPGLSLLGAQYTNYRIRGIALKLTFWQTEGVPVFLYTTAQSSDLDITDASSGPAPGFPTPSIGITPEQRWARYAVCQMTQTGGRATKLKSYYSVNKVFGPDAMVRNSPQFCGETQTVSPFWQTNSESGSRPTKGPWLQYGIATLSGAPGDAAGVLKIEATVYAQFFGKRIALD